MQYFLLNDAAAQAQLDGVIARLSDFSPVFRGNLRSHLQGVVKQNFASRGGLSTPAWKRLSPQALATPRIDWMRVTDRLFSSLTRNSRDSVFVAFKKKMRFGTKTRYAEKHQEGLNVPRRQVIPDPFPETLTAGGGTMASLIERWIVLGQSG